MDHHAHMDHTMGHMDHSMSHDVTAQVDSAVTNHMNHGGHNLGHTAPSGDHGGMHHNMSMGGHNMAMSMWFEALTSGNVLFKQWKFDTVGGLLASMLGIFLMAALYEGLKYYREYLFWKTYNTLQYRAVTIPEKTVIDTEDNQIVHVVSEVIHKQPPTMWSRMHFFQTSLHMIQMVLSYFLMLIFMTYNVYLCIAVVLGAGVGYFLFGWKKSVIVDVTEHCH